MSHYLAICIVVLSEHGEQCFKQDATLGKSIAMHVGWRFNLIDDMTVLK